MHFLTTLTATTALLAPALAAPAAVADALPAALPQPDAEAAPAPAPVTTQANKVAPANYWFNVTGWSAGCARAGCYYDFNVSAPQTPTYPGFKAYCYGADTGYFSACQILGGKPKGKAQVAAKLKQLLSFGGRFQPPSLTTAQQHIDIIAQSNCGASSGSRQPSRRCCTANLMI